MRTSIRKSAWVALGFFALWTVFLVATCTVAYAQGTYSFGVKWTPVEVAAPFQYQVGIGLEDGTYTTTKMIGSQWTTAEVIAPSPGPWFIAVRSCLLRGDADPLCSSTWTKATQTQGGTDYGPFYPVQIVIPVVPEAWLTAAPGGPGG